MDKLEGTLTSPKMVPTGAASPMVYVLGEAPGEQEDLQAEQFIGSSGQLLRQMVPLEMRDRVRYNNTIRCRPPDNRTPTATEINCCYPSIVSWAKSKTRWIQEASRGKRLKKDETFLLMLPDDFVCVKAEFPNGAILTSRLIDEVNAKMFRKIIDRYAVDDTRFWKYPAEFADSIDRSMLLSTTVDRRVGARCTQRTGTPSPTMTQRSPHSRGSSLCLQRCHCC